MDIGSILLILALFVAVALFVARPLFLRQSRAVSAEEHELSGLLAERDRLVDALQELDFDFALQKIPEDEYPQQRMSMLERGAAVLRRIDEIQHTQGGASAEKRMEAAIARRRADAARESQQPEPAQEMQSAPVGAVARRVSSQIANDEKLEAMIASRRRDNPEKPAGFCPSCGTPLRTNDRFCPRCGAQL